MERKEFEFKAFDRVLVRDEEQERWQAAFYDQYIACNGHYPHHVISGDSFAQCIPYEGNEHLLGTTDRHAPKPEPWKPKEGETYFVVFNCYGHSFFVSEFEWDGDLLDEETYRLGNCFRTRQEAQKVADKFNALLEGNGK